MVDRGEPPTCCLMLVLNSRVSMSSLTVLLEPFHSVWWKCIEYCSRQRIFCLETYVSFLFWKALLRFFFTSHDCYTVLYWFREVEQRKTYNHNNYNFLACDWFKKTPIPTNSLAKLLSDTLLSDNLLSDSLLSDISTNQSNSKLWFKSTNNL